VIDVSKAFLFYSALCVFLGVLCLVILFFALCSADKACDVIGYSPVNGWSKRKRRARGTCYEVDKRRNKVR